MLHLDLTQCNANHDEDDSKHFPFEDWRDTRRAGFLLDHWISYFHVCFLHDSLSKNERKYIVSVHLS